MKTLCKIRNRAIRFSGLAALTFCVALPTIRAQLLENAGFESGLTGWTFISAAGGSSWFSQTGAGSPVNGFAVHAPTEGAFAAMTDQSGPGSRVLFQDFVVPSSVGFAAISFDYTINNQAGGFITGPGLDYASGPNQQARVDIITTTANEFSVTGGDVLLNLFQTNPGDPRNSGTYNTVAVDLTGLFQAHLGETLRLRFSEVDNQLFFNFGVDNVQLSAGGALSAVGAVPEPSTYGLFGAVALAGLTAWKRSRRVTTAL